jgi:hypothetical protein
MLVAAPVVGLTVLVVLAVFFAVALLCVQSALLIFEGVALLIELDEGRPARGGVARTRVLLMNHAPLLIELVDLCVDLMERGCIVTRIRGRSRDGCEHHECHRERADKWANNCHEW